MMHAFTSSHQRMHDRTNICVPHAGLVWQPPSAVNKDGIIITSAAAAGVTNHAIGIDAM
jgi:hypothetical protein